LIQLFDQTNDKDVLFLGLESELQTQTNTLHLPITTCELASKPCKCRSFQMRPLFLIMDLVSSRTMGCHIGTITLDSSWNYMSSLAAVHSQLAMCTDFKLYLTKF
jgi:hypothetical protein